MDNIQMSEIIKNLCKSKHTTVKSLLEICDINRNFMYDLKNNKKPSVEALEKIADYLDCSVDYLLGRVDTPNATYSISNQNTTVTGTQANIINNNTTTEKTDNLTEQFMQRFEELSFDEKVDVMQYVKEKNK